MKTCNFRSGEYDYLIIQFDLGKPFVIYHGISLIGELEFAAENWVQISGAKLPNEVIADIGKQIDSII